MCGKFLNLTVRSDQLSARCAPVMVNTVWYEVDGGQSFFYNELENQVRQEIDRVK